jgi:hypothetical protein
LFRSGLSDLKSATIRPREVQGDKRHSLDPVTWRIQFASIGRNASHHDRVGRGCGVERGLGVTLGVAVGFAVGVGVVVGVGVSVGPPCAQYLPPLLK